MQNAAWETARLRVRATSLAAENDALKGHVEQLMHQIANMDKSVQVFVILLFVATLPISILLEQHIRVHGSFHNGMCKL